MTWRRRCCCVSSNWSEELLEDALHLTAQEEAVAGLGIATSRAASLRNAVQRVRLPAFSAVAPYGSLDVLGVVERLL
jgi:hypothetical protein